MFKAQQIKELNDSELQVFEFIMNNQLIVPYLTIRELASHSNVSTTTILRFIITEVPGPCKAAGLAAPLPRLL